MEAMYYQSLKRQRELDAVALFALSFSPCGEYILAASSEGRIAVWDLKRALNKGLAGRQEKQTPILTFKAHPDMIYSMIFVNAEIFLTGGDTSLRGWSWTTIKNHIETAPRSSSPADFSPSFELIHPAPRTESGGTEPPVETNAMDFDQKSNRLYCATGSRDLLSYDLNSLSSASATALSGHRAYIHAVACRSNASNVCSASEDGTVRVWDTRTSQSTATLNPFSGSILKDADQFPRRRQFVSSISVNEASDAMICGGSERFLAKFHIPSLSPTAVMPTFSTPHVSLVHEETVFSGGNSAQLHRWKLSNGEHISSVATSSPDVWTVEVGTVGQQSVVAVSGSSRFIDLFVTSESQATVLEYN
eukprot:137417_1